MKEKISEKIKQNSVEIMLLMGMVIRFCYVIFTKVVENRQYDLGQTPPDLNKLSGHLGYIYYFYLNKQIPNFDPRTVYQYYHPPVHHIIEALWMGICSPFIKNQTSLIEALQIPTCIYSCIILIAVFKICKLLNLDNKAQLIVMIVMAFNPSYIFMAGSINNDGLSLMFQFLIIYETLKWYKERKIKNIIILALYIGFGMLTKLSAGLLAVPVAFVFLYVLINDIKNKKVTNTFIQLVVFGIICVPLGLSWAIRCLVKFDMPVNYAYELSKDSWQYVGDYSKFDIFFLPNIKTLLINLKNGGIGLGENMWIQLFRTSALGECDLSEFPLSGKLIALLMICINFLVALIAFWYLLKSILKLTVKNMDSENSIYTVNDKVIIVFFWLIYIVFMLFYVSFIYKYPFECTMNFRYILPTVLIPSLFMGAYIKKSNFVIKLILFLYILISIMNVIVWCI